jgi:hypothetical protein
MSPASALEGHRPRGGSRRSAAPATARGLAVAAVLLALCRPAAADECWVSHRRGPYPVCFDPGNRLRLDAAIGAVAGDSAGGQDGVLDRGELGGAIQLRHVVAADDPDVTWLLEHQIAAVRIGGDAVRASAYSGRFVRHASDGRLVLPFGRPRNLFLPFDIGAEAEVGSLRGSISGGPLHLGAVRTAAVFDLSRTGDFRRRFALGAAARWDIEVDAGSRSARAHTVAPFSVAAFDLRAESRDGLTAAGLRGEAGAAWSTAVGWRRWVGGEAELERVFLSVQDRPLSVFVSGALEPADESVSGVVGLRIAPLVRIPHLRPGQPPN